MKTAIKIIAVLMVLLVVLVIGVVVLAFGQVDKIAKRAVEYGGTYAMSVDTTVDTMDVALTQGTVEMGGLNIANPEGFDTEHFFALDNANAALDIQSVRTDTIVVPSIKLSGIDVILDKGNNPSNYNQILENLSRFESGEKAPADETKAGKNVVIKSLILEDINIRVANMPGVSLLAGDVAVKIPSIELQNIGEAESMKAGDIFNLVIKTVLAAAVEAGGGIIPGDVLGELGNGLAGLSSLGDMGIDAISDLNLDGVLGDVAGQVGEAAGKVSEDAQKAVDDAVDGLEDTVNDAVDDAKDQLKGIFGNKKEDKP
tara:strand:+ start:455 stop:1396 length:942 start_codon:yes stop_codon:yes gene_type:complete